MPLFSSVGKKNNGRVVKGVHCSGIAQSLCEKSYCVSGKVTKSDKH